MYEDTNVINERKATVYIKAKVMFDNIDKTPNRIDEANSGCITQFWRLKSPETPAIILFNSGELIAWRVEQYSRVEVPSSLAFVSLPPMEPNVQSGEQSSLLVGQAMLLVLFQGKLYKV